VTAMEEGRSFCIRCGECCLAAGPTLQRPDLILVREGAIAPENLFTIRRGEVVRDNVHGGLARTGVEMVKVREREDGG